MIKIYTKKTEILHTETRIIENVVVKFNIIRVKRSWLWGLFQVAAKLVVPKYNRNDVSADIECKFNSGVKSVKYAIMNKHWDELTQHDNDDWD